ncbi:MAG: hypothetical protein JWR47_1909 [Phenylobacterium sp.]|jgi:hypothetical protein|uniref:hypothetical protein n=1 Tax=Phenylobacterium sp. TaxID=1871053 RepID=UPI00261D5635|nr:hypothetical protein [Phenylobacterium sp.]MDB5427338.1 hypothetical protein [Phenylobacterium sp.]MDB5435652.1 hypothetical protein [Phenylobacterium sp.]MDB5461706.1 hypothetical protein [Phenylobacterium sp.]MDB5496512.1 hypothetical protein [Phenylobacterium sp.]
MRYATPLLLSAAALALGGCMTTRSDGSPKVQTSNEANRENLKGVAESPLRDMNVLRTKIPPVLLQAMADPYQRPTSKGCAQLNVLLQPLTDALGADLDAPEPDPDDLMGRGKETAMGLMSGAASDMIPFRGWIRKLTGAERHDRLVQQAITAGAVRRSYLKGLGEAKGCDPPATPSHQLAGAPVLDQSMKPRYPVR